MARLSGFQLSLLSIWGVSAIAALSGSFWLAGSDWSHSSKNSSMSGSMQTVGRIVAEPPLEYKEEALALRESLKLLERRNRMLTSRLDALESDMGTITASIPTSRTTDIVPLSELTQQSLPAPLPGASTRSTTLQKAVKLHVQPFPLKVPGTNRAPSDAEIGEALLAQ
ncbi:MAG: hypothetical protein ABJO09_11990 [Hyphomicrobiales bacterium]